MKRFLPKIEEMETLLIIDEYLDEDILPSLSLDSDSSSVIEVNFVRAAISSGFDPVEIAFSLTRHFITGMVYLETYLSFIQMESDYLINSKEGLMICQRNVNRISGDKTLFKEYFSDSLDSLLNSFPEYYGGHDYKPLVQETMEELRRKKNIFDSFSSFKCFMCGKTISENKIIIVTEIKDCDPYTSKIFFCSNSCRKIYLQG